MRTLILMHKYLSQVSHDITLKDDFPPLKWPTHIGRFKAHYRLDVLTNIWVQTFTRIKIMWCDERFWNGRGVQTGRWTVSPSVVKPQGLVKGGSDARRNPNKALCTIRHAAEKRGSWLSSLPVCVSVLSVCHPPGTGGGGGGGNERLQANEVLISPRSSSCPPPL